MLKNKISLALLLLSNFAFAQEIVKDINNFSGSQIDSFDRYEYFFCVPCGNYVYFRGTDALHGRELWRTDGTAEGTILVKDLWEGPESGLRYSEMYCLDNQLVFRGFGITKSDGTEAGTVQLTSGFTNGLVPFEGKIAFKDDYKLYIATLDQQNVTPAPVYDFGQGANETTSITIMASDHHVFVELSRYSTTLGKITSNELWAYDGTSTTKLKSLSIEDPIFLLATVDDNVVFSMYDGVSKRETWVSDGTVGGTQLLNADLSLSRYSSLAAVSVNDKVLLGGNSTTWLTDGTPGGTTKIVDLFSVADAKIFNNKIYLLGSGNDGTKSGSFIKRVDMNFAGAVNITSATDTYTTFSDVAGNKLFFNHDNEEDGNELYYIDASENVGMLKEINPGPNGSYPRYGSTVGNKMMFLADDGVHGFEMWKTDGTEDGTSLIKDVAGNTRGSSIANIYRYNDKLYFHAVNNENANVRYTWESDGTEVGTKKVNNVLNDYLIFAPVKHYIVSLSNQSQFLKTDLNTGTSSVLANIPSSGGGGVTPAYSASVGDDVYFYFSSPLTDNGDDTGIEIWKANPETNQLSQPKNIAPDRKSSNVSNGIKGAALGNKLIFSADETEDDDREPWVTDGTGSGTFKLKDIVPGASSNPNYFTTLGKYVLFFTNTATGETKLWSTDGTSAGTVALKDSDIGVPTIFGLLNGNAFFSQGHSSDAPQLWTTDGTSGGTSMLKTIGTSGDYINYFMNVAGKVYFVVSETQLWVTDGTADGTRNTRVSIENFWVDHYTSSGETLVFSTTEGKIWATLGDPTATEMIGEGQVQSELFAIGDRVIFLKDDDTYGRELFKIDIPELEITVTGLEESVESFKIYPNPTANTLFVKAGSPAVLRIIDMNGREKHNQFVTGDVSIDISNYADGLYVATLDGSQQKFIKRH
jgi:ELWxxDGT repeat protein